jgi:hypothetical protein
MTTQPTLRVLLAVSSPLAVIALALPWTFAQFDTNSNFDVTCTRISFWLAVWCLGFLIVGVIRFRSRGLWLALPLAVACAWTAGEFWMWSGIMDVCAKTGRCP